MKITIESTEKMVEVNGVPARVWDGKTESGIKVSCLITRIAVDQDETKEVHELFASELNECRPPIEIYDARLIL